MAVKEFYNGQFIITKDTAWNFTLGNRNAGKSFFFKMYCIKRFLEHKELFCLLHRKVDDVKLTSPGFFFDVLDIKYKDKSMVFKPATNGFGRFYLDGELCGYSLCIKNYVSYKKMAELQAVCTILFDEFLSEDGDYLKNEVDMVRNIYSTIARGGGEHIRSNVRMFFISNTVSMINPYFDSFEEIGNTFKRNPATKKLKGSEFTLEIYANMDAMEAIANTGFGKSIAGTKYGLYAMNNSFYCDNNKFVEVVKGVKDYIFTFVIGGKEYALYDSLSKGLAYISTQVDPTRTKYVFDNEDHDINYLMFSRHENTLKGLKKLYEKGAVRFESLDCKVAFLTLVNIN